LWLATGETKIGVGRQPGITDTPDIPFIPFFGAETDKSARIDAICVQDNQVAIGCRLVLKVDAALVKGTASMIPRGQSLPSTLP